MNKISAVRPSQVESENLATGKTVTINTATAPLLPNFKVPWADDMDPMVLDWVSIRGQGGKPNPAHVGPGP